MQTGVRRLSAYPRHQLLDDEAFSGAASELALLASLGHPTVESKPGSADPCFFWDLIWDCGLVLAVEYHQLSEKVHVHLDLLDFDHAIRHMGGVTRLVLLPETDAAAYRLLAVDEPDRRSELWVPGEDGEPALVAPGLTERDGRCRQVHLDGSWVSVAS